MKKEFIIALLSLQTVFFCAAQKIQYCISPATGAIESMTISNDTTRMNWVVKPDGSQYPWVTSSDGWGLGYFTAEGKEYRWSKPTSKSSDTTVTYQCGDVIITVSRKKCNDGLIENYKFTNKGSESISLTDMGIFTPFNDNYPDAKTCVNSRCHAHVWAGGNSTYVYALRMGAYAPHIGLILTEGSVSDYEIWHRGNDKGNSQTRGIIALCPDDMTLKSGKSKSIEWKIFTHEGKEDFCHKASKLGCNILSADNYLVAPGQAVSIVNLEGNKKKITVPCTEGFYRHNISYNGNKKTYVDFYVVKDRDRLIADRLKFILGNQRMSDRNDSRYGAFMIYDCEGDSIYPNDTPNCNPVDRDEGAERTAWEFSPPNIAWQSNPTTGV